MPITPYGAIQRIINPILSGGTPLYAQSNDSNAASTLQSTISAATSGIGILPDGVGHHPLTCTGKLYYDQDRVFSCEHFKVPANDARTQAGLNHSLALLLIEEALNFCGMEKLPYQRYM